MASSWAVWAFRVWGLKNQGLGLKNYFMPRGGWFNLPGLGREYGIDNLGSI